MQNAKALRQQLRSQAHQDSAIGLFASISQRLSTEGWDDQTANTLLKQLCEHLGATHGLFAMKTGTTLTVQASQGNYYPQAARIPITGQLSSLLKPPCLTEATKSDYPLWSGTPANDFSRFIAPVCYQKQALGIVAFAKQSTTVSQQQQQTCQITCGMLALHWQAQQNHAPIQDLSILEKLTPREREVFALLPTGKSNAALGKLLGISGGTVKIHVERILSKLDLNDRTQAAVKAVSLGYSAS